MLWVICLLNSQSRPRVDDTVKTMMLNAARGVTEDEIRDGNKEACIANHLSIDDSSGLKARLRFSLNLGTCVITSE
jgi:hypothetical protein